MAQRSRVTGVGNTKKNLSLIEKKGAKYADDLSTQDLGEKILELCQNAVPIEEGMLRNSGTVQEIGRQFLVGYNKEYAAVQHESAEFNHPLGGQAFFLTGPIKQNQNKLLKFKKERYWFHFETFLKNNIRI